MTLTVPDTFSIQIKMMSDWHVGSGSGRGEIDSAVQRDADSLPYIPAKTLTGILRDGCEQVALALDKGEKQGTWHDWISFLFGDQPTLAIGAVEPAPCPATLSMRSAHFPQELRDALKARTVLKNALVFIKPGVAIDSETGSAKPDFLRFEEVVRMGATLIANHCTLDFSEAPEITDDQKKVAYALLVAGAKLVDRLGGKRRRGNGTCTIIIDNQDQAKVENWINYLQENYDNVQKPPEWKREKLDSQTAQPVTRFDGDQSWYRIPLIIKTQTPVVIPKRTVGNVVESLDYIPGRYFLRHLHRTLGKHLDVSGAIARGDLVITNATIAIDGKPGRPTPFCLFGKKLDGGLSKGKYVYNRFQEAEPKDEQGKEVQTKGERSGYLGEFDGSHLPEYRSVSLKIFTHNTIRDDVQRPTSDVGGVYSYQAIPAGTTLMAELRLPQSIKEHLNKKAKNWGEALSGELRLGQSKKDQYGSIHIEADKPEEMKPGKLDLSEQAKHSKFLYVWFLSDVLLRDKRLNLTTDPQVFKQALEKALELPEESLKEQEDENLLSLMMKSRRTESWQVRWGLPRPSMLGWQAGSCLVYEVEGEIKPEKLAELETKGIGDRRVEGYGQICFNDPLLKNLLSHLERKQSGQLENSVNRLLISNKNSSFNYARTIERAAWREVISNRAMAIASDAEERKKILGLKIVDKEGYPNMSQLGGVRSNLRKLKSRENIPSMRTWINSLQEKRADKWEKTQDGLDKLSRLVTQEQDVWRCLESENSSLNLEKVDWKVLSITRDGVEQLKQDLWAETVRTLVDAVIRAHKRDLEKEQQEAA